MPNTKTDVATSRMVDCDPDSIPIEDIDVSQAELYEHHAHWPLFERLRRECPVHYCAASDFGPYWSITRFEDIIEVDKNHQDFSSEPTVLLGDVPEDQPFQGFIQMDPPKHDVQRAAVQGAVAPRNLTTLEPLIRSRVVEILEQLPDGETFDWVDRVSIELTTRMLATLFDFPFEERRRLTRWSDVAVGTDELSGSNLVTPAERMAELGECMEVFAKLWRERQGATDRNDFIAMLANNPATRDLIDNPREFLGNLLLLIVGGNDTTRNSISGGIVAMHQFPDQIDIIRESTDLIPAFVSELIRWQTPISHMRRRATRDVEFRGQQIREGDKVVMWYISGNRDESAIEVPTELRVLRKNPRHHLAFGFGLHRCMGNRLAEMQLRIVWEELLRRFDKVELVGEPQRVRSNFVNGYAALPVRVRHAA